MYEPPCVVQSKCWASLVTVTKSPLQVITLEGWVEIMYYVMDAHSFYNFIYFILLIIVSTQLLLLLFFNSKRLAIPSTFFTTLIMYRNRPNCVPLGNWLLYSFCSLRGHQGCWEEREGVVLTVNKLGANVSSWVTDQSVNSLVEVDSSIKDSLQSMFGGVRRESFIFEYKGGRGRLKCPFRN